MINPENLTPELTGKVDSTIKKLTEKKCFIKNRDTLKMLIERKVYNAISQDTYHSMQNTIHEKIEITHSNLKVRRED